MKRIFSVCAILYMALSMVGLASADSSMAQSSQSSITQGSASSERSSAANENSKSLEAEKKKCESLGQGCKENEDVARFIIGFLIIFYVTALSFVVRKLQNWKLSEALSEEKIQTTDSKEVQELASKVQELASSEVEELASKVQSFASAAQGEKEKANSKYVKELTSKTQELISKIQKPTLVPSASRFIAFIGSIVLVGVFVASSFYIVWALFTCQSLSSLKDLGAYLLYGAALFMPYAVNKLSEIFKIKS